jgi:hypothetical protein
MTRRINTWSSPRNISTALMYAFAQRSDTTVVDEPLYAHYLSQDIKRAIHPGEEAILQSQEPDGEKVVKEVILGHYDTPVAFFKQMTHHLVNLNTDFLEQCDHILLIRSPRAIIHSYTKVVQQPSILDVGIKQQYELYQQLKSMGKLAAVLDCDELLKAPEQQLRQLCEQLDLSFEPKMLHWPAGPRPEDGVWAKYWYHSVHQSTGFKPYQEREYELSSEAEELARACMPYYEGLKG